MTAAPAAVPHDYDPATDTVRVSRPDLARLLIQFRAELERTPGRRWSHMTDWDKSFERLADAVDYARAHYPPGRGQDARPDDRMRCKLTVAYDWPGGAPYDGGQVDAVRVTDGYSGRDRGSHYVTWRPRGAATEGRALCGFSFVREESRPARGAPSCPECVREKRLAELAGGAR